MSKLAVEFLGSGGAVRTPRPGCQCENCRMARRHGPPWERLGPSVFVHGPDVLIDTPEDSCFQVDRANLTHIAAGLYSHWHPDHTAGKRMWETRNGDFRGLPPQSECTPIYLPPQVWRDFEHRLGLMEAMRWMEHNRWIKLHLLDAPITLGGWRITPHLLTVGYCYAFLFEEVAAPATDPEARPGAQPEGGLTGRRVLIAMDELFGWEPPTELRGVDLAVLPKGLFEFNPLTGERIFPPEHPILRSESTDTQTLQMVEALAPRRLVLMHLEEPDLLTPPDYAKLAAKINAERGWDVTFAHDTLVVEL